MSAPIPTRLAAALADQYWIERELGVGGMATVYLAQDLKHQRKIAIKVLRPELIAALGAERFLREIQTTANLRHPHILDSPPPASSRPRPRRLGGAKEIPISSAAPPGTPARSRAPRWCPQSCPRP